MASSTDELDKGASGAEAPVAPVTAKVPVLSLVLAMVVAVVVGAGAVGGGMMYLVHAGKLGGSMAPSVEAHEVVAAKTHGVIMEPILVNLMDAGSHSYLRTAITLRVVDEVPVKGAKEEKGPKVPSEAETSARDIVLTVLGQQTSDGLLEADGKEHLKTKLRAALAAKDPDLKVTELFFTEFLVQR